MATMDRHTLDSYERRAREGKLTTRVEADLQMTVALVALARAAARYAEATGAPTDLRLLAAYAPLARALESVGL